MSFLQAAVLQLASKVYPAAKGLVQHIVGQKAKLYLWLSTAQPEPAQVNWCVAADSSIYRLGSLQRSKLCNLISSFDYELSTHPSVQIAVL